MQVEFDVAPTEDEYVPGKQGKQAEADLALVAGENVPLGQGMHAVNPRTSAYVPGEHAEHKEEPSVLAAEPVSQVTHVVLLDAPARCENVPGGHKVQFVELGDEE